MSIFQWIAVTYYFFYVCDGSLEGSLWIFILPCYLTDEMAIQEIVVETI